MPVRVKICGVPRAADAALAVDLGASAIGFVLWPRSPRAIPPRDAAAIARALPPFVSRVGVFVDETPAGAAESAALIGLDVLQLHGDEPIDGFAALGRRVVKVV